MRHIHRFLPLSLLLGANAFDTSIFTFDSYGGQPTSKNPGVTDAAAKRLVELRMAPPEVPILGQADQGTMDFLNRFGGPPSLLFGVSPANDIEIRTIILEGLSPDVGSLVQAEYPGIWTISQSCSGFSTEDSLGILFETKSMAASMPNGKHCTFRPNQNMIDSQCLLEDRILLDMSNAFAKLLEHADTVDSWVDGRSKAVLKISTKAANAPLNASIAESLKSLFRRLSAGSSETKQVTTLILSSAPGSDTKLLRRGVDKEEEGSAKQVGAQSERRDLVASALAPICYASEESCNETTNYCSGHGFCYKRSRPESETAVSDCYTCKCQETIVKKQDGTIEKIQWAGSACQKREVSSPFFLLAGVTVMGVLAVSTAIGLLFKVGQDELPSVIGAGVGAARAQN